MQLILLAAGYSTRFGGGLKQLAPVGPNEEAIMDYTARDAAACGFEGIVLVVREEIKPEIEGHIRSIWPSSIPVDFAVQGPISGTASAVSSAAHLIHGSFAVANADDLYGKEALGALATHLSSPVSPSPHTLIAFHLERTIITAEPVKRGLCRFTEASELESIVDHVVVADDDGTFEATPLEEVGSNGAKRVTLKGDALVSMNLWGFHHRMLDDLEQAVTDHANSAQSSRELLLPDVVDNVVHAQRDAVRVIPTDARCIGITHRDDLQIVRDHLAIIEV